MKASVRRRYKMVWVWFLTAPDSRTRPVRIALWFAPWVAMNCLVTFKLGLDLAFTFASLVAIGSFWFLGYMRARRDNVRDLALTVSDAVGEPLAFTEFDLKRSMREQASQLPVAH